MLSTLVSLFSHRVILKDMLVYKFVEVHFECFACWLKSVSGSIHLKVMVITIQKADWGWLGMIGDRWSWFCKVLTPGQFKYETHYKQHANLMLLECENGKNIKKGHSVHALQCQKKPWSGIYFAVYDLCSLNMNFYFFFMIEKNYVSPYSYCMLFQFFMSICTAIRTSLYVVYKLDSHVYFIRIFQ